MANIGITSYEYFENGISHGGEVVGSLGNGYPKYVARYGFTTGENGASSVSLSFASGTVDGIPKIPEDGELIAIISTNANAYTNHLGDDITDAPAKSAFTKGAVSGFSIGYSCTIEYIFLPNTDYYIFVVPKSANVGVAWAHSNYISCTASGSASFDVHLEAGTGIAYVTGAGNYVIGATVTVSAKLATGYKFAGWAGDIASSDIQFTFAMPAQDVSLSATATVLSYALFIAASVGAAVTVERKSSPLQGAKAGFLYDGDVIYHSDSLQIGFSVLEEYALKTHTVNGKEIFSGSTHNVTGNVKVVAMADALAYIIGNGSDSDLYYAYIGDGAGGGDYYVAYIGTDNGPVVYGSGT